MKKDVENKGFQQGRNLNYLLAGQMWKLYVNNCNKYVVCHNGEVHMPKSRADGVPQALNMKKILGHMAGYFNIGVFASAKAAKFICFDIDLMDKELVLRLIDRLVELGFPRDRIYPSISGGKGYHVEIFSDSPVANNILFKLYRAVVDDGGFDRHKVEFRPTEGQAIKLPLSRHYKTGNMCWYCDNETLEPVEAQEYVFQIKPMKREKFCRLVAAIKLKSNGISKKNYRVRTREPEVLGADIDNAPTIREPHTRHDLMLKYGRWLRGCGFEPPEIYHRLMDWVDRQDRRLISSTDKEVEEDARQIAEWMGKLPPGDKVFRRYGMGRINSADLNYILNGKNKTERRILFRSVLAQKIFGKDQASQRLIADSVGVTAQSVKERIAALHDRGVVTKISGVSGPRAVFGFFSTPNTYVSGDSVEKVLEEKDLVATSWDLTEKLEWRHLLWYYAGMMTEMLGPNMKKYIGAAETKDVQRLLAEVMDDSSGDGDDG